MAQVRARRPFVSTRYPEPVRRTSPTEIETAQVITPVTPVVPTAPATRVATPNPVPTLDPVHPIVPQGETEMKTETSTPDETSVDSGGADQTSTQSDEQLETLTVAQLVQRLRAVGQPTSGTKVELVERLRQLGA